MRFFLAILLLACCSCDRLLPADDVTKEIRALQDPDPRTRQIALAKLGQSQNPRAVAPLLATLQSSNVQMRAGAAIALGQLQRPEAVAPLLAMLHDQDPGTRARAADALGASKDGRAVEPLIALLKDENPYVRQRVPEALGRAGDARAFEPLVKALQDADSGARMGAADGLGLLKDARAVEPLIAVLQTDGDSSVRHACAWALGQMKDARAVDPLVVALIDPKWLVRDAAATALGELKDSRAVEPLLKSLQDHDSHVQRAAVKALARIHDQRAIQPLTALLTSPEPQTQDAAKWALQKLEQPASSGQTVAPAVRSAQFTRDADRHRNIFMAVQFAMLAAGLVIALFVWRKRARLLKTGRIPPASGWRFELIPYRSGTGARPFKECWEASMPGMVLCLTGIGLFILGILSVLVFKGPKGPAIVIAMIGWPLGAFGLLLVNRGVRRDWLRIEATCLDRDYKRVATGDGNTWQFRWLCKFKLDGKEYTVTPYYYSTMATEKGVLSLFAKAISSQQTCSLWVNPRNPLETELSVGGLPDFLLH